MGELGEFGELFSAERRISAPSLIGVFLPGTQHLREGGAAKGATVAGGNL
jgi:hypothetical protein